MNGDFTFAFALAEDSQYLYAGGNVTNADNISGARRIARWDGTNWSRMGSNLPGYVFVLKRVGTNLYAGGIFPTTNSTYNCLARWAGNDWEMVGGKFAGGLATVNAIEADGPNLHVGGTFTSAGGVSANNVAMWNGST